MAILTTPKTQRTKSPPVSTHRNSTKRTMAWFYPGWFLLPAVALYVVLFAAPTIASFYFSMTRWDLFTADFTGFDNYIQFFQDQGLVQSFVNTFVYAAVTCGLKIVFSFALALLLTSPILGRGYLRAVVFFPVLVSTIGVGLTFKALLDPFNGPINTLLAAVGISGPGWLTDPHMALLTVAAVDIWKGVGTATLIYIAAIVAIPQEYTEAAKIDGAAGWNIFRNITLPLSMPATGTVLILSLIGGLRSFDLIWSMTGGGPGFASDVISSVIYKEYQGGYYGLSTASNVVLMIVILIIMVPVNHFINKRGVEA